MPKYQKFEDLPVWQEAARLYNRVLDLLEQPNVPFTPGFRNQLDRAALSVSNNIAEGFERVTTNELLSFLAIARGSSGEVRSMMAVVKDRPKLKRFVRQLQEIRALAETCARQLTAWTGPSRIHPCKAGATSARGLGNPGPLQRRRATTDWSSCAALNRSIRFTIQPRPVPPVASPCQNSQ